MKMLWQPQHKPGWFVKASKWMESCVRKDGGQVVGRVSIRRMTETSTVLVVNSNKGRYFLKAPSAGSNEVLKTMTIAKLFRNATVDVVDACEELGTFVSPEAGVYDVKRAEQMDRSAVLDTALNILVRIQLGSLDVIESLKHGGVPVVEPHEMVAELENNWLKNDMFSKATALMKVRVPLVLPMLEAQVEKLKQFKIPLTLIHGGFAPRNIGFKKVEETDNKSVEKVVLLLLLCDTDSLDEYLAQWSEYESLERTKECYELAKLLAPLLSAFLVASCMEKGVPGMLPNDIGIVLAHFNTCIEDAIRPFEYLMRLHKSVP